MTWLIRWCLFLLFTLGAQAAGPRPLSEADVQRVEAAIPSLPAGLPETDVLKRLGLDPIRQVASATAVGGQAPDFTTTYTLGAAGQLAVTLRGPEVVRVEFSRRAGAAPTAVWPDRAPPHVAPQPSMATTPAARAAQIQRDAETDPEEAVARTPAERRRARALKYLAGMTERLGANLGVAFFGSLMTSLFLKLAIRIAAGASVSFGRCYLLSVEMIMLTAILNGVALGALMFAPMEERTFLVIGWCLVGLLSFLAPAGVLSRVPDEQTGLPIGWWRGLRTFLAYLAVLCAPFIAIRAFFHFMLSP